MALQRSFLSVQFGLVLVCASLLSAQLNRGAIEGSVADPQGAAMSGVAVTITSVATNVVTSTKTNSAGYYRAEALVPGNCRAHFAVRGFSSLDITAIEVPAAQVIQVDAKLKVGSINKQIGVKAELPMLETDARTSAARCKPTSSSIFHWPAGICGTVNVLLPGVNNVGGPPGSNFGFDSQFGTLPYPTHMLGSALPQTGFLVIEA
jgi:hypothetical protein